MANPYLTLGILIPDAPIFILPVDNWTGDIREFELTVTSQQGERSLVGGEYRPSIIEGMIGLTAEELELSLSNYRGGLHGKIGDVAFTVAGEKIIALPDAVIQLNGGVPLNGNDGGKVPFKIEASRVEIFSA